MKKLFVIYKYNANKCYKNAPSSFTTALKMLGIAIEYCSKEGHGGSTRICASTRFENL